MAYEINRTLGWIGTALDRARGKSQDGSDPRVIPNVILPKVDVFGWEALQRMKTAISIAAVGVDNVLPLVNDDWPAGVGGGGVVPPSVALRIVTGLHLLHDDELGPFDPGRNGHRMWVGVLDREGGSTAVPTETGPVGDIVSNTPLACTRVFFLRPLENFIGRVRAINALRQLRAVYTWIDLKEGEYISGQIF